jgi:predicted dehydrogenase
VLTIHGGHVLDMLWSVLGAPRSVEVARLWSAVGDFTVLETGERLAKDAPDNLVAVLDLGGVPVNFDLSYTAAREATTIEFFGTHGSIHLAGPGQPQLGPLTGVLVDLDGRATPLPDRTVAGVALDREHPGFAVALAYRQLAQAAADGVPPGLPDFPHAAAVHEFLTTLEAAGR